MKGVKSNQILSSFIYGAKSYLSNYFGAAFNVSFHFPWKPRYL